MVTFGDVKVNGRKYLLIKPSRSGENEEELKLRTRDAAPTLVPKKKTRGPASLPCWSKENLKTGEIFLLSSHPRIDRSLQPYELLYHDISSGKRSWGTHPSCGEFSYKPLYWEWAEDVLGRCQQELSRIHIFEAVRASLFLYGRCPNLIKAVCEHWCPATNTFHTVKGEVSISLLDIHHLLGLPLSGLLYDEVVPSYKFMRTSLPASCTYLFAAYHKLMHGRKGKPPLESWIQFWFRGSNKYHVSETSNQSAQVPSLEVISSITNSDPYEWGDLQLVFEELQVERGKRSETFLAAFLSCWLCHFILPVRDVGRIRPGIFQIASLMASGRSFCLPTAILASIYKGLGDISRSLRGTFPFHFLYAWLGIRFGIYNLGDEATISPSMVQFGGIGRAKSFTLEEARSLIRSGEVFRRHSFMTTRIKEILVDGDHLSVTDFAFFVSLRSSLVSYHCEGIQIIEHYCPHRFSRQFGFHQDIPNDVVFGKSYDSDGILSIHQDSIQRGTGSKVLCPGRCTALEKYVTCAFEEWWTKLFLTSPQAGCSGGSKRKRDDASEGDKQRDKPISEPALKVKPPRSGKPLKLPVSTNAEVSPAEHIPGVGIANPIVPVVNPPVRSVSRPQVADDVDLPIDSSSGSKCKEKLKSLVVRPSISPGGLDANVFEQGTKAVTPPAGAENILDVLDIELATNEGLGDSDGANFGEQLQDHSLPTTAFSSQSFSIPDCAAQPVEEEVDSISKMSAIVVPHSSPRRETSPGATSVFQPANLIREAHRNTARLLGEMILKRVRRKPTGELFTCKNDFASMYDSIAREGVDPTPLKEKVEGLIEDACNIKALEDTYSKRVTRDSHEQHRMEVESKLKAASECLVSGSSHHQSLQGRLTEIQCEREELLKKLKSLEEEHQELESSIASSEALLQQQRQTVSALNDELAVIKDTAPLSESEEDSLNQMRRFLADSHTDVLNFVWDP